MARYDREFLVPYLQNICALHLLQRKLQIRYSQSANYVAALQRGVNPMKRPNYPYLEISGGYKVMVFFGIFFLFMGLCFSGALSGNFIGNFFLAFIFLLGIGFLITGCVQISQEKQRNEEKLEKYYQEMDTFNRVQRENEMAKRDIPTWQAEMQRCKQEENNVNALLQKAYSANVIPSSYRDIYAAVYLYDWFSTSYADDMGMALNMFVLEQIKAKLDKIIENQSEIILNQCMMLANQQQSMEQQRSHAAMMEEKLSRIAASNEEANRYRSMIASNTETMAYFAAADYIRKI